MLFGEGGPAMTRRLHVGPHNGFLDVFFLWGLGGTAMFVALYGYMIAWSRTVMKLDHERVGQIVAWGAFWGVIAIAGAAMTLDPWYVSDYRYFVYFLLAILWQRREAVRLYVTDSWADSGGTSDEDSLHAHSVRVG